MYMVTGVLGSLGEGHLSFLCDYRKKEPLEEERCLDSGGFAFAGNQKTLKVVTLFEGISQNPESVSWHNAYVCEHMYVTCLIHAHVCFQLV